MSTENNNLKMKDTAATELGENDLEQVAGGDDGWVRKQCGNCKRLYSPRYLGDKTCPFCG